MRNSKHHLYLTDFEYNSIVNALIKLNNTLIYQGKYSDGVNVVFDKTCVSEKEKIQSKISPLIGLTQSKDLFIDKKN